MRSSAVSLESKQIADVLNISENVNNETSTKKSPVRVIHKTDNPTQARLVSQNALWLLTAETCIEWLLGRLLCCVGWLLWRFGRLLGRLLWKMMSSNRSWGMQRRKCKNLPQKMQDDVRVKPWQRLTWQMWSTHADRAKSAPYLLLISISRDERSSPYSQKSFYGNADISQLNFVDFLKIHQYFALNWQWKRVTSALTEAKLHNIYYFYIL